MANPKDSIKRLVKAMQLSRLTDEERLENMLKARRAAKKEGKQVRAEKGPPAPKEVHAPSRTSR